MKTLKERFCSEGGFGIQGCGYETPQGTYRFFFPKDTLEVTFTPTEKPILDEDLKVKELANNFSYYVRQQDLWRKFKQGLEYVTHLKIYKKWNKQNKEYEAIHYRNTHLQLDYVITYYCSGLTYQGHIEKSTKTNMDFCGNWDLDSLFPKSLIDSEE